MLKGSIDKIETLGLVDGPGIRIVIFLNGCNKRCKYCHNPEMWKIKEYNYTVNKLVKEILKYKPYIYPKGGVTFSGGEPLLQSKFLLKVIKKLKKYHLHIAIDTAGNNKYYSYKVIKYTDLIILDVKEIEPLKYFQLTNTLISDYEKFIKYINKLNKEIWIRQVIITDYNDNIHYLNNLALYLKKINNIKKIELLPYHTLGKSKYKELNIYYPLENVVGKDINIVKKLEEYLINKYNSL